MNKKEHFKELFGYKMVRARAAAFDDGQHGRCGRSREAIDAEKALEDLIFKQVIPEVLKSMIPVVGEGSWQYYEGTAGDGHVDCAEVFRKKAKELYGWDGLKI